MTNAAVHRSADRAIKVTFRVSAEQLHELKRRAAETGVSVQVYMGWKTLDLPLEERPSGPEAQQRLPLADTECRLAG